MECERNGEDGREPRARRVSKREWLVHNESGLVVNCGWLYEPKEEEEDCISMERMVESRLEDAPSAQVDSMYPHLRGVELLCGHKFCAVNLLWSWVLSKMCCPVCRREFPVNAALPADINGLHGKGQEIRALRKKILDLKREDAREAEMQVLRYVEEEYLTQVQVASLLQQPSQFWIRLSFFGADGRRLQNQHRFFPLNRVLVSMERARMSNEMPRTRMQVQRADLRSLGHVLAGMQEEVLSVEAEIVLGHYESLSGRRGGVSLSENIRFFIPRVERNEWGWNIRPASDSAMTEFTCHGREGLAHSTLSHTVDECDGVLKIEFEHNLASTENRQVKITDLFMECDTVSLMGLAAAARFSQSEDDVDVELGFTFERGFRPVGVAVGAGGASASARGAGTQGAGAQRAGAQGAGAQGASEEDPSEEAARTRNVRGTRFFVVMHRP